MLGDEIQIFKDAIATFVHKSFEEKIERWERECYFPDSVFRELGAQGYLGILIPEQFGGVGADYNMAAAWCQAFGKLPSLGLTTAVNMHSLVISPALAKYGTQKAKEYYLPKACTGEYIGAYAFTEPGAGSDLASITTVATKQGNRWILNGRKTFITNGARAKFILVLAKTDKNAGYNGFTTFVVDSSSPGFKVNRKLSKLGWHCSDTAELSFEDVEIEDWRVLGEVGAGWKQAVSNLNWERLMLTILTVSATERCLKETIRYTTERKAFGKRLIDIEAIRAQLQSMLTRYEMAAALTNRATRAFLAGGDSRNSVSTAKLLVCEECLKIADAGIQLHGGYGYTTEFKAERWWRDIRLMPIGGGTSEIMANIVAKDMGWLA